MTQTIKQLLADLILVSGQIIDFNDKDYQGVVLTSDESQSYSDANDVIAFLQHQGSIHGWVQETSFIHHLHNENYKHRSIPLNGEWYDGTHSYVLEYVGKNGWLVKKYTLQPSDNPTHLAQKMVQCEVDSKQKLVYQRLWRFDEAHIVADIAVFVGFEGE